MPASSSITEICCPAEAAVLALCWVRCVWVGSGFMALWIAGACACLLLRLHKGDAAKLLAARSRVRSGGGAIFRQAKTDEADFAGIVGGDRQQQRRKQQDRTLAAQRG